MPTAAAVDPIPLSFPKDDSAHPGYTTEWWYYNGHLQTATGEQYGFHEEEKPQHSSAKASKSAKPRKAAKRTTSRKAPARKSANAKKAR